MKANLSQTDINRSAGEIRLEDKVVKEEPSYGRQILNILRMAKPPTGEKHVRIEEPNNNNNVLEKFTNGYFLLYFLSLQYVRIYV